MGQNDAYEFAFMVTRAFASGANYTITETSFLDCVARHVEKRGFRPYLDILGREGLMGGTDLETKTALTTLLLAIGFEDGNLVLSQHLNELTVERMVASINDLLE